MKLYLNKKRLCLTTHSYEIDGSEYKVYTVDIKKQPNENRYIGDPVVLINCQTGHVRILDRYLDQVCLKTKVSRCSSIYIPVKDNGYIESNTCRDPTQEPDPDFWTKVYNAHCIGISEVNPGN